MATGAAYLGDVRHAGIVAAIGRSWLALKHSSGLDRKGQTDIAGGEVAMADYINDRRVQWVNFFGAGIHDFIVVVFTIAAAAGAAAWQVDASVGKADRVRGVVKNIGDKSKVDFAAELGALPENRPPSSR